MMKSVKIWTVMMAIGLLMACSMAAGVKSVEAGPSGGYCVVGIGPGDADLLTARAVSVIRKADIVFCDSETREKLAGLVDFKNKQVLDGYGRLFRFHGKVCGALSENERTRHKMTCEEYHKKQAEFAALVRKAVAEGKNVVMLSHGDPTIYGPDIWTLKEFKDIESEVVPGLSCFNAANAALAQGVTEGKRSHSVILASGWSVEEMAALQSTLVLFTMRTEFKKFIDALSRHYPSDTPIAIVSSAGYARKEKVLRGRLDSIMAQTTKERLPFEYMIYVGDFLK